MTEQQPGPSPAEMRMRTSPDVVTRPGQFRYIIDTLARPEQMPPPLERMQKLQRELSGWKKDQQLRGQGKFLEFFSGLDKKQHMEMFSLYSTMMNSTDHLAEISKLAASNNPAAEAIASGLQYAMIATKLEQPGKTIDIVDMPYADPALKKLLQYKAHAIPSTFSVEVGKKSLEQFAHDYALARASVDPENTKAVTAVLSSLNDTHVRMPNALNERLDVVRNVHRVLGQLAVEIATIPKKLSWESLQREEDAGHPTTPEKIMRLADLTPAERKFTASSVGANVLSYMDKPYENGPWIVNSRMMKEETEKARQQPGKGAFSRDEMLETLYTINIGEMRQRMKNITGQPPGLAQEKPFKEKLGQWLKSEAPKHTPQRFSWEPDRSLRVEDVLPKELEADLFAGDVSAIGPIPGTARRQTPGIGLIPKRTPVHPN